MSIARTNGSEQTRQPILAAALRLFAAHERELEAAKITSAI
jgi:hypothetical protein